MVKTLEETAHAYQFMVLYVSCKFLKTGTMKMMLIVIIKQFGFT